jgi:alpha-L-fucosidase
VRCLVYNDAPHDKETNVRNIATWIAVAVIAAGAAHGVDLLHVPQIRETKEQRDGRMQWFRDAKFGMFIHWGPCSVGQKEIGWGREANRPWDINKHGPRTDDPVYDSYYQQFNPTNYDADAWVRFAKESGMKYMVLIAKHHDGFSQFDSKLTDYDIMAGPYGKDIVKAFVEACHRHGMKAGLYYSTRDWYHPDYLVGDNAKYDAWYRGQVEELLTNYGAIDVMWFDHVGGRDWGKWKFDELFSMMYRLHPRLIVNNRAARFCGPNSPEDRGPASPEIRKMTDGDYDTPEGRIGSMNVAGDWESCIHVGKGWSYRGEDGFKGPEDCIKMLVSCTTGGGNLLLNFGPRPDGTFADGEAKVARAMGDWLKKYGDAIYGTRGGPYRNGPWGGSCHKGTRLFLHLFDVPKDGLSFDALPGKITSARTLFGASVNFTQNDGGLTVRVAPADRDSPVTVVELALEQPLEVGRIVGDAHVSAPSMAEYGRVLSDEAVLALSSGSVHDAPADHERLFRGRKTDRGFAFHTGDEKNPWARIDLGAVRNAKAVAIENRPGERRTEGLILSVSTDGKTWEEVWKAPKWEQSWTVPLTRFQAGIDVPGRPARYLKVETRGDQPRPMLLQRLTVYGEE